MCGASLLGVYAAAQYCMYKHLADMEIFAK